MDLTDFQGNPKQYEDLVVQTIPKGKFINFKTGIVCVQNTVEKGDILFGVMPKEDGTEVLGFWQYKGVGCPFNMGSYDNLFNTKA